MPSVIWNNKASVVVVTLFVVLILYNTTYYHENNFNHRSTTKVDHNLPLRPLNSTNFVMYPKHKIDEIFLLVLVSSSPHDELHAKKRSAIRNTWANCSYLHQHMNLMYMYKNIPKSVQCKLVFFIGLSGKRSFELLQKEANEYNDLLILNHMDTYATITTKLFSAFEWASHQRPKFILKTDDDVYIHVPKLITNILMTTNVENFYGGVTYAGSVPRDPSHRHYISKEQYYSNRFPVFCKGAFYVFSGNLLPSLLASSYKVTRFGVDDAYVGVLMHHLGVQPVHLGEFVALEFKVFLQAICDCSLVKLIGIGDGLTGEEIRRLHKRVMFLQRNFLSHGCLHLSILGVILLGILFLLVNLFVCVLSKHKPSSWIQDFRGRGESPSFLPLLWGTTRNLYRIEKS